MKKETKKWVVTASLAFACALSCAAGLQNIKTSAASADDDNLKMLTGASIRMDISTDETTGEVVVGSGTGIRFSAVASKDLVSDLVENGAYKAGAELGMFMVPAKYITDYIAQEEYDDYFEYFSSKKSAQKGDITYVYSADQLSTTENNNIHVTLESLKDVNYDLSYQAVAYYTLDGETYCYTTPSEPRKVAEVAHAALTDEEKEYDSDQRTALGNIIEKSIVLKNDLALDSDGYYEMTLNESSTFDLQAQFAFAGEEMDKVGLTVSKENTEYLNNFIEVDKTTNALTCKIVGEWLNVNVQAYNGDVDLKMALSLEPTTKEVTWGDYELTTYGASDIVDDGVTLLAGSYSGAHSDNMDTANVPYVAIEGDYSWEKTVVVDFTGGNMPNIALFANQPDGNTKNFVGTQAIMFSQGVRNKDGGTSCGEALVGRINVYGPRVFTKWNSSTATDDETVKGSADTTLTYTDASLSSGTMVGYDAMKAATTTEYRLMVKFYERNTSGAVGWTAMLMQKNADYDGTEGTYPYTLVHTAKKNMSATFAKLGLSTGSIIIYGRPYEETKIDKLHAIYDSANDAANILAWTGETVTL